MAVSRNQDGGIEISHDGSTFTLQYDSDFMSDFGFRVKEIAHGRGASGVSAQEASVIKAIEANQAEVMTELRAFYKQRIQNHDGDVDIVTFHDLDEMGSYLHPSDTHVGGKYIGASDVIGAMSIVAIHDAAQELGTETKRRVVGRGSTQMEIADGNISAEDKQRFLDFQEPALAKARKVLEGTGIRISEPATPAAKVADAAPAAPSPEGAEFLRKITEVPGLAGLNGGTQAPRTNYVEIDHPGESTVSAPESNAPGGGTPGGGAPAGDTPEIPESTPVVHQRIAPKYDDATGRAQTTLFFAKLGGHEGIDMGNYPPEKPLADGTYSGIDGARGRKTRGTIESVLGKDVGTQSSANWVKALDAKIAADESFRKSVIDGLAKSADSSDPAIQAHVADFLKAHGESEFAANDPASLKSAIAKYAGSVEPVVAATEKPDNSDDPITVERPPVVKSARASEPLNLKANFGAAVWEKETVSRTVETSHGPHASSRNESRVTITPSVGIRDKMPDWLGNKISDRDWATSLGYGRDNKFPAGTSEDVIQRASEGVFSFGDKGEIYLTRIDPRHGLDRYEVSEYIAKNGIEGSIALHSDEKTSRQLHNALEGMSSLKGFDKEAGLVLKMEDGVKIRVYEADGEVRASIVGEHANPDLLAKAEHQTPGFIAAANRDWDDLNKSGDVGKKAIDDGFAAQLLGTSKLASDTPEGEPKTPQPASRGITI